MTSCFLVRPEPIDSAPWVAASAVIEDSSKQAQLSSIEFARLEAERRERERIQALLPGVVAIAMDVTELAWREALDSEGVDCVQWLSVQPVEFVEELDFEPGRPAGARGSCTIERPVRLRAEVGNVTFDHDDMLMSCELARAFVAMSQVLDEHDIVEVEIGTPYSCRTIRGRRRLSEPAHGLAPDVATLIAADGTEYSRTDH